MNNKQTKNHTSLLPKLHMDAYFWERRGIHITLQEKLFYCLFFSKPSFLTSLLKWSFRVASEKEQHII